MPVFKTNEQFETRMYARTKTLSIFWSMFSSVVLSLDQEYWVTHCGVDGYLYLLFQRRFLRLTIVLSVINLALSVIMNWIVDENNGSSEWFD
jgi:hypothetical protein